MAEIRVERKERPNPLPWILGLILLALIVWGLVEVAQRNDTAEEPGSAAVDVSIPEQPPALRQYATLDARIFEDAA